ncbi:MAG: hypothetical protein GFH27_549379n33 [Chloroflexi bacterium AL-W]|nr:hypothetical protein [Chloroflexi bacterium AL-N1]NOK71157.1 hypothetical protein [Chloroflexi bacterium AL-N10]NOK78623.1 hypothetical protein [Chloroflexi bacterium AL-N5]NOK85919.1 hypothetical protein [Chloroflexi bacterium AL-W]NOK92894.1 hypothetical protein [Chloroflexi bacterium AL-N15]
MHALIPFSHGWAQTLQLASEGASLVLAGALLQVALASEHREQRVLLYLPRLSPL